MKISAGVAVVAAVVAAAMGVAVEDWPVVTVSGGLVRGANTTAYNITYLEFLGIPFATPPIGSLRFKDPLPAEPWEGELDASTLPPPCDQLAVVGKEDCLYLNVYTPEDALFIDYPMPVMVYIHGGGYYGGGSFNYHGFQEFVSHGMIVVLAQYRLGLFGFLSTEDAEAPGNQGLKDQTLALQWVQDNIAAFGGDPTRVTIFGSSAGSTSVQFQMLAPSAAGLFSGAIMESGSALSPWATGRDFLATAQTVAERFDCPTLPTADLVACLQTVRAHQLDTSYFSLYDWNLQPFYLAPRVDGEYLPDEPATLLQEGRYHHVPTIMGVNRDEMAMETVEMYAVPSIIDSLLGNFSVCGPASLHLHPDEDPINTTLTVYNHYLGGLNITKENIDNLTKMYTERLFHIPHDWTTQVMSGTNVVYTYELHHRGEHSFCNQFVDDEQDLPQAYTYISHGDNNQYLMYPRYGDLHTPEDQTVGHLFTSMWINFANARNPTPDDSLGFTWEMTEPTMLSHLKILPEPFMETDQRAEARAFWESLPLRINSLLNH
ncbi:juvenile hormone esterase-like [Eriocheir sinensis]|uniref:juvenile hormone esterase-like n=1 Tax=Eriocheir sinensis TaxID=95602 RepID=UPI0021CABAF5|nr:juvenile hormone esterase-like [Eriocheir sinensis]XP_050691517.1 juvenile hormone esterase-like [Eriocheir sinensis]